MATISENLQTLQTAKQNIKSAIESKGQDLTNVPFTEYANKISAIQSGGGTGTDRLQWKCDNVKSLYYEFYEYAGTDLSILDGLDTSQVTNMNGMFNGCRNITNIPELDTRNVTNMYYMFFNCAKLVSVPKLNTSKVTNFSSMFWQCYELTSVPELDTRNATNVTNMFVNCKKLTTPLNLDIPKANSLYGICSQCNNIPSVSIHNTTNVTQMNSAFQSCEKLVTIETIDMIKVTQATGPFNNCKALENLTLKNIKINLGIGSGTTWGTLLTNASLLNTAQELWDNYGNALGGARTLTMSATSKTNIQSIYVKLVDVTDEMIAEDEYISNKKPCVECASTDEGAMTLEEYIIGKNWVIA